MNKVYTLIFTIVIIAIGNLKAKVLKFLKTMNLNKLLIMLIMKQTLSMLQIGLFQPLLMNRLKSERKFRHLLSNGSTETLLSE
jgi:hypothetical protein